MQSGYNKSTENYEHMPGETMFEFLKRKKKFMLQQTLGKSKIKSNETKRQTNQRLSVTPNQMDDEETKRNPSLAASKSIMREQKKGEYLNNSSIATPRRVSFEQEKKPAMKSFTQMISPLRSKSPINYKQKQNEKTGQEQQRRPTYKQNHTKKMLNEKINIMRQVIQGFVKTGKNLKEKSHSLFIQMKPLLRHVQKCQQSGMEKKTDEVKAKLKIFQNLFKQFQIQDSSQTMNQFYQVLSQYLNELQGYAQTSIEQNKNSLYLELRQSKDNEIECLKDQKRNTERQLDILRKKYEKIERTYNKFLQDHGASQENARQTYQEKLSILNRKLEEKENNLKEKNAQLDNVKKILVQKEAEIKNHNCIVDKLQREFTQKCSKIKSQRQSYLLNEIMILKQEFNSDITQLVDLHNKQKMEMLEKIKYLEQMKEKLTNSYESQVELAKKLEENCAILKSSSNRYKKQSQCLATDMHRINEELYQHWLALKDIKTLSTRLETFNKFKKIYEDLAYNQHLFL